MPAGTSPIFPQAPIVGIASLVSATPVTSRAPITGTTGLVKLTDTSTNGTRIDAIEVVAQGNSTTGLQNIWIYNGTTSYMFDEISIATVTANTVTAATANTITYTTLTLPPTYQLYVSQQVASNVTIYAFGGTY